jgi:rRNA maturation endonuclease Nob1
MDAVLQRVHRQHESNRRLNDAGLTYNVWLSRASGCMRCGSVFPGHRCDVVGSPTQAHRLAQPQEYQAVLW